MTVVDPNIATVAAAAAVAAQAQAQANYAAMLALVSLIVQTLGAVLTALIGFGVAWIGFKQKQQASSMGELAKNTNSIKDALIKETAESSEAKGVLRGKAEAAESEQKRNDQR